MSEEKDEKEDSSVDKIMFYADVRLHVLAIDMVVGVLACYFFVSSLKVTNLTMFTLGYIVAISALGATTKRTIGCLPKGCRLCFNETEFIKDLARFIVKNIIDVFPAFVYCLSFFGSNTEDASLQGFAGIIFVCYALIAIGSKNHRSFGDIISGVAVLPTEEEDIKATGLFDLMFNKEDKTRDLNKVYTPSMVNSSNKSKTKAENSKMFYRNQVSLTKRNNEDLDFEEDCEESCEEGTTDTVNVVDVIKPSVQRASTASASADNKSKPVVSDDFSSMNIEDLLNESLEDSKELEKKDNKAEEIDKILKDFKLN